MTINIGVGGVNKLVSKVGVGVGGVWKNTSGIWVGVGGVWKQTFSASGSLTPQTAQSSIWDDIAGNSAGGRLNFQTTGALSDGGSVGATQTGTYVPGQRWLPVGETANTRYVRITPTSGTLSINSAVGWTLGNVDITAAKGNFNNGATSCTFTVEVASDAAGTNIIMTSPGWVVGYSHT